MFGRRLAAQIMPAPSLNWLKPEDQGATCGRYLRGRFGTRHPEKASHERQIAGAILACWSLVHELTLLLADGLVGPRKKSGALSDSLVQGMLDGLAAELPILPPGTWVGPQVPHQ